MATTPTSNIERARELMRRSRREHFAIGAFNVDNQETLVAIVRAAQASPRTGRSATSASGRSTLTQLNVDPLVPIAEFSPVRPRCTAPQIS
jgi:hypothetical protein